jgi:hypothetical protein
MCNLIGNTLQGFDFINMANDDPNQSELSDLGALYPHTFHENVHLLFVEKVASYDIQFLQIFAV